MARTPDGLEYISDEQRALDVYLAAEKKYHESPEDSPDNATLLLAMAVALAAKQLAKQSVKGENLNSEFEQLMENLRDVSQ